MSHSCKSLIRRLLEKKESKRLGSKAGASEVKAHPFFKSLKFALLRHMTPPIVPGVTITEKNNLYYHQLPHSSGSLDLDAEDEPVTVDYYDHSMQDPFAKFNSGKLHKTKTSVCMLIKICITIVSLYHDGDSDAETIALSSEDEDDMMDEKYK